ncbi:hypothetical protein COLO4_20618 [Corchorus olitorius]|uniref:Uncharacterized protein n=1 Tax=Corchorus olitorius TaxID=93759 RepID=A0A1R3IYN8_9ROSI|nr:hypothetical protein COLO4_20618 [Corchorus olitorius]
MVVGRLRIHFWFDLTVKKMGYGVSLLAFNWLEMG